MKHDNFSLFRYFAKEYHKRKLTKEQLVDKLAYAQQITGIKPVTWRGIK
ncbi:MAG: hypothetical protein LBV17_07755 [Treponema sp.]|jgi:hypothetical protein|nr:hypothetical protein [Treponema sp.]